MENLLQTKVENRIKNIMMFARDTNDPEKRAAAVKSMAMDVIKLVQSAEGKEQSGDRRPETGDGKNAECCGKCKPLPNLLDQANNGLFAEIYKADDCWDERAVNPEITQSAEGKAQSEKGWTERHGARISGKTAMMIKSIEEQKKLSTEEEKSYFSGFSENRFPDQETGTNIIKG